MHLYNLCIISGFVCYIERMYLSIRHYIKYIITCVKLHDDGLTIKVGMDWGYTVVLETIRLRYRRKRCLRDYKFNLLN